MTKSAKDRFFDSFLDDATVDDILTLARQVASETTPKRRGELLDRIDWVIAAEMSKDSDKVAAACFHLGVKTCEVASLKGRQIVDRDWVEFAKEMVLAKATNRQIQPGMELLGFPERSTDAFDEWIRRNVRRHLPKNRKP